MYTRHDESTITTKSTILNTQYALVAKCVRTDTAEQRKEQTDVSTTVQYSVHAQRQHHTLNDTETILISSCVALAQLLNVLTHVRVRWSKYTSTERSNSNTKHVLVDGWMHIREAAVQRGQQAAQQDELRCVIVVTQATVDNAT